MSELNPSIIGMITKPVEQFERIRKKPLIWMAMGIVMVLYVIGMWLTMSNVDIAAEIANDTGVPLDDELMMIASAVEKLSIIIGGVISPLFGILLATIIHVLIAKMVEAKVTFRQLFSMNTYITFITAIGIALNGILYVVFNSDSVHFFTNLGHYIQLDGAGGEIVNSIEVFSIWTVILTAIGLEKVAKMSRKLSWSIAIIIFLLGIITSIISLNMNG